MSQTAEEWAAKYLRIKELEAEIATLKEEQESLVPTLRSTLSEGQRFNFFDRTWEYSLDSRSGSVSYKEALIQLKPLLEDQDKILLEQAISRNTKPGKNYPKLRLL